MRISLLIAGLLVASCGQDPAEISDEEIKFISTDDLKTSGLPLSTAVEVDGWIFLSGALGTIPGEGLAKGGIGPETRQTMENIQATLAGEGLGMDRIVKCTAMLADMSEWPAFNSIYKEFFDADYPARSAFAANGLAADARVEIECIARR